MTESKCDNTSLPELLQLKNKFFADIEALKIKHFAILNSSNKYAHVNIAEDVVSNGDISLNELYKDDEIFSFINPNSPRSSDIGRHTSVINNNTDIVQTNSTPDNKYILIRNSCFNINKSLSLQMSKLIQFNIELGQLKSNYLKSSSILAKQSVLPKMNNYQQFDSDTVLNNTLIGLLQEYLSYVENHILPVLKHQKDQIEKDIDNLMKLILNMSNINDHNNGSSGTNNHQEQQEQRAARDGKLIKIMKEGEVIEILRAFIDQYNESLGFGKGSENRHSGVVNNNIMDTIPSSASFSSINIATWTLPLCATDSHTASPTPFKILPMSIDEIFQQILLYYNDAKVKLILTLHQQYQADIQTIQTSFQQSCVKEIQAVMIEVESSAKQRRSGLIMSKYEAILLLQNNCTRYKTIALENLNHLTDKPYDIELFQEFMSNCITTTIIPLFLQLYYPLFHAWLKDRRKQIEKEIDKSVEDIINNSSNNSSDGGSNDKVMYNEEEITLKISQILVDMKKSIGEQVYINTEDDRHDESKEYTAHFEGLFHYYLDRTSQARKVNFIKLETEIDRLILVLTTDMRQARDGLLKQMGKSGNRGESMMISLTEALEFIAPKLYDMKNIYAESIIKLLGDKNHPGVIASLQSVDSTITQMLDKLKESYVPIFLSWIQDRTPFIEKDIHMAMEELMSNEEGYSDIELSQQFQLIWNHAQRSLGSDLYITNEELKMIPIISTSGSNKSIESGTDKNDISNNSIISSHHVNTVTASSSKSFTSNNIDDNSNSDSDNITYGYLNYKKHFKIALESLQDVYQSYIELITASNNMKYTRNQLLMNNMLTPFVQQVEQAIFKYALNGTATVGPVSTLSNKNSVSNNSISSSSLKSTNSAKEIKSTTMNSNRTSFVINAVNNMTTANNNTASSSSSSATNDAITNTSISAYTREELYIEFEGIVTLYYKQLKDKSKDTAFSHSILKAFEVECEGIKGKLNDYYTSKRLMNVNYILSQIKLEMNNEISLFYVNAEKNTKSIISISDAILTIGDAYILKAIELLSIWELTFHEQEEWIKMPLHEYIVKCRMNCINYIERIRADVIESHQQYKSKSAGGWFPAIFNNSSSSKSSKKKPIYL